MMLALKENLEALYRTSLEGAAGPDPVDIVRRYEDREDAEIAAFVSAFLSLGRVSAIKDALNRLMPFLSPSPYRFIRSFTPEAVPGLMHFRYRFYGPEDLFFLFYGLRRACEEAGSLEHFFMSGYKNTDVHIGQALSSFVRRFLKFQTGMPYRKKSRRSPGAGHFLADPADGSGCKRLVLFLRWMVRDDGLDLGLWKGIPTDRLIIPLDTHVIRVSRCIGLTRRASPGWRMAEEITESLKLLDPHDPVKYDFALCHAGMSHPCPDTPSARACAGCPLRSLCIHLKETR